MKWIGYYAMLKRDGGTFGRIKGLELTDSLRSEAYSIQAQESVAQYTTAMQESWSHGLELL